MKRFVYAYIKSMRLYYSFITLVTGLVGIAYIDYIMQNGTVSPLNKSAVYNGDVKYVLIFIALFFSWGVNQIFNDYLGLKEDRINAPHRPMVTGELNHIMALALSGFLILITCVVTWIYLSPKAVPFVIIGTILNIVYSLVKKHWVGILFYGLSIISTVPYAIYAVGVPYSTMRNQEIIGLMSVLLMMHMVMCYFTYFKDYAGDKEAKINTLVVMLGLKRASRYGLVFSLMPVLLFILLKYLHVLPYELNFTFIALGILSIMLLITTGFSFYLNYYDKQLNKYLKVNTRACTCGSASMIALFSPDVALWTFMLAYILIGVLFDILANAS